MLLDSKVGGAPPQRARRLRCCPPSLLRHPPAPAATPLAGTRPPRSGCAHGAQREEPREPAPRRAAACPAAMPAAAAAEKPIIVLLVESYCASEQDSRCGQVANYLRHDLQLHLAGPLLPQAQGLASRSQTIGQDCMGSNLRERSNSRVDGRRCARMPCAPGAAPLLLRMLRWFALAPRRSSAHQHPCRTS